MSEIASSTGAAPFRVISNWEVCLCIGGAALVFLWLRALDYRGLDVACGAVIGVLLSCAGTCWPLRRHIWFWITAAVLAFIHLLALLLIDWSFAKSWTGLTIMPFMAADTLLTLGVIYAIFRLIHGRPLSLFEPGTSGTDGYANRADS